MPHAFVLFAWWRDDLNAAPAPTCELLYTLGVPAFVRNRHFDHVIWHAFVLAGSVMIYWSLHLCIEANLVGTL